jgi:hypothetical protein
MLVDSWRIKKQAMTLVKDDRVMYNPGNTCMLKY